MGNNEPVERKLILREKVMKYSRHQKQVPTAIVVVLCIVLFALTAFTSPRMPVTYPEKAEAAAAKLDKKENDIRMSFVGDIMMGRYIGVLAEEADGYGMFFDGVKPILEKDDISFGNMESAFTADGKEYTKEKKSGAKSMWLNSSYKALDSAAEAGFDAFGFANNHTFDYSTEAITDLCNYLEDKTYVFAGIGRNKEEIATYRIIENNGLKIAFVAITDAFVGDAYGAHDVAERSGVLTTQYNGCTELIAQAAEAADLCVVYAHWGVEGCNSANDIQTRLAHNYVRAGANIVIGSHPHVLESCEIYRKSLIVYSVGNFVFDQGMSINKDSVVVSALWEESGDCEFTFVPCRISNGAPSVTNSAYYKKRIRSILSDSLKDGSYDIDQDGYLHIKLHFDRPTEEVTTDQADSINAGDANMQSTETAQNAGDVQQKEGVNGRTENNSNEIKKD